MKLITRSIYVVLKQESGAASCREEGTVNSGAHVLQRTEARLKAQQLQANNAENLLKSCIFRER